MKVFNLLLLVLTTSAPQRTRAQPAKAMPRACASIKKAATALHRQDTRRTEESFLQAFPGTYAAFTAVFGYRSSQGTSVQFGCLYETSEAYVEQLFALRQVPPAAVFAKLVGISRQAHWQSDGLNYLKHHSMELATQDPAFLAFLNAQPAADIRSFTRFLILNPVSNEPLKKQLTASYAPYRHLRAALQ